jgi:hypothetical protein
MSAATDIRDPLWSLRAPAGRSAREVTRAKRCQQPKIGLRGAKGRLARLKARHGSWDILAETRFFGFLKERKIDHKYWENLRTYYERLGVDSFWRLAREHREFDPFRAALSAELRRKLLANLDEDRPPEFIAWGVKHGEARIRWFRHRTRGCAS